MLCKVVVLLFAVVAVSANVRVPLRPCPGGHHLPEWFESIDCTPERCTLRRGQVFSGRAHVITREAFTQLWVGVEAFAFGIPVNMPIPEGFENACDFLEGGARCPVTSGGAYTWSVMFPIMQLLPALPNVQIRRKFETLQKKKCLPLFFITLTVYAGEDGRRVACGEIDAEII